MSTENPALLYIQKEKIEHTMTGDMYPRKLDSPVSTKVRRGGSFMQAYFRLTFVHTFESRIEGYAFTYTHTHSQTRTPKRSMSAENPALLYIESMHEG